MIQSVKKKLRLRHRPRPDQLPPPATLRNKPALTPQEEHQQSTDDDHWIGAIDWRARRRHRPQPTTSSATAIDPIATITTYLETHRVKVCDAALSPQHNKQQKEATTTTADTADRVRTCTPEEAVALSAMTWRRL